MSKEQAITITNCNNIVSANIIIKENELNILYGNNGTGKSTISKAIFKSSDNGDLSELIPYKNTSIIPKVENCKFKKVMVFNEESFSNYLFQKNSLVNNTFDVFIRTEKYDEAIKNIEYLTQSVKELISNKEEIIKLKDNIQCLLNNIVLTSTGKLTGNIKKIVNGKGAYFNPPQELNELKEFCSDELVSEWVKWKTNGIKIFGDKGKCPYCATENSEKTKQLDKVFEESFDKGSIESSQAIKQALTNLYNFIDFGKQEEILSLFGVKEKQLDFENLIKRLQVESQIIKERLINIISFNSFSVDKDEIDILAIKLNNMKINISDNIFFTTEKFNNFAKELNTKIEELIEHVSNLQSEIGKSKTSITQMIKNRETTINRFLGIAGYNYKFEICDTENEEKTRAVLKFKLPDGNFSDELDNPRSTLSWGERNAFALILFMFKALSEKADLIILDDPISSFDGIKKYTIMQTLFQPYGENSLNGKTILFLTHDFNPVIDFFYNPSGTFRGDNYKTNATYIKNINGIIHTLYIEKNDIFSSYTMWENLAKNSNIDPIVRVSSSRKLLEYQYQDVNSNQAYHILSNLIHARPIPLKNINNDIGGDHLTNEEISNGEEEIKKYITDFDYSIYLSYFDKNEIIKRYSNENNLYFKMTIFRAYLEQDTVLKTKLIKEGKDSIRKGFDETMHIENDYLFTLNLEKFDMIDSKFIEEADNILIPKSQEYALK